MSYKQSEADERVGRVEHGREEGVAPIMLGAGPANALLLLAHDATRRSGSAGRLDYEIPRASISGNQVLYFPFYMPDQSGADLFVVISGCSAGGKSTLLAELGRRGYAVVEEPGRRIVREELNARGSALPWVDATAFARRAVTMSLADRGAAAGLAGWVFFDRGLIDAAVALQHLTGEEALLPLRRSHRYHQRVFLAPPWPEIYVTDRERRHDFDAALTEYQRLLQTYPSLGYEVLILPKIGVRERADFVLSALEE